MTEMIPIISIVVPIYNAEKYLRHCIESILQQTFTNFELLLINDGSTDSSQHICDDYSWDSRVRVFRKSNRGVSAARNFGIKKSIGKYLTFVDSDDYLEPNALELLYRNISNGDCDLVCASYRRISSKKELYVCSLSPQILTCQNLATLCYEINFAIILGGVWGKLYKKEIISNHKISFPENIHYSEDNIYNIQYYKCVNAAKIIDSIIYNYYDSYKVLSSETIINLIYNNIEVYKMREQYFRALVQRWSLSFFANQCLWGLMASLRNLKQASKNVHILKDVLSNLLHNDYVNYLVKHSSFKISSPIHISLFIVALKTKNPYIVILIINFTEILNSNAIIRRVYKKLLGR